LQPSAKTHRREQWPINPAIDWQPVIALERANRTPSSIADNAID
jgi:hypothetical protein